MKKIYLIIAAIMLSITALMAQSPEKFSYQAVVRDAAGHLISNGTVNVRISILQSSPLGDNVVYLESHTVTTNLNGLLTLEIGGGNSIEGSFSDIDWANGPFFLKTEIDPDGNGTYAISSEQQLMSVPYALYAKKSENGFSGNIADYFNSSNLQDIVDILSDAGLATEDAFQVLSISNDTLFLTNGGFVVLPAGFSGDYNELTNKPNLAAVATSGSYNDLTDKPTIPNDENIVHLTGAETITGAKKFTSEFQLYSASGGATPALVFQRGNSSSYYDWSIKGDEGSLKISVNANTGTFAKMIDIYTDKTTFSQGVQATSFIKTGGTASQFLKADGSVDNNTYLTQHQDISGKANTEDLANVAFSGNYNDLTNKPTIPAAQVNSDWNATSGIAKILNKPNLATVATSGSYNDLTNKPTLFSGNYNDLTNKPTIPAAQVNSDWNATSGVAKILNKPTILSANDVQGMINNAIAPLQQKIDSLESVVATYHAPITIKTILGGDRNSTMVTSRFSEETNMSAITSFGLCWSTSPNPTTSNSHVAGVLEEGDEESGAYSRQYTCTMSSLTFGTLYYIRAYYVTAAGTFYSPQRTFTPSNYAVPTSGSKSITITGDAWIYDYAGAFESYKNNWDGTLVINSGVTGKKVQIDQGTYSTEANYDSLSVYCGTQWLAQFSGTNGSITNPIQGSNGVTSLTLKFRTDGSNTNIGFAVHVTLVDAPCKGTTSVTDYDLNHYPTIEIGTQCWMKTNLKCTHYANGNAISSTTSSASYYPGWDTTAVIGYYYNWAAAMKNTSSSSSTPSGVQGICPNGWHLPSNGEWTQLFNYLKGQSIYWSNNTSTYIAKAMAYPSYWTASNTNYTPGKDASTNNKSGFGAVPTGCSEYGDVTGFNIYAYFWSSTQSSSTNAYACTLSYNTPTVSTTAQAKTKALPVRCVKNN